LRREGVKPNSPSLWEEKGPGDELIIDTITILLRFGHLVIGTWCLFGTWSLKFGILVLLVTCYLSLSF
jgi:hypothetical protein